MGFDEPLVPNNTTLDGSQSLSLMLLLWISTASTLELPFTPPSALVLSNPGQRGRLPFLIDPIEAQRARGTFTPPREGDRVPREGRPALQWKRLEFDDKGKLRTPDLRSGYAYFTVEGDRRRVVLLHVRGHRRVFVNGDPRGGDYYDFGWTRLPIVLQEGTNTFLIKGGRGQNLQVRLQAPEATQFFERRDSTLPDVLMGEPDPMWCGLVITNATEDAMRQFSVRARVEGQPDRVTHTALETLGSTSGRKYAVRLPFPRGVLGPKVAYELELLDPDWNVIHQRSLELRVRSRHQAHKRTFPSRIDSSVQYYGVRPRSRDAEASSEDENASGLILSLHGAGVEGARQAASYTSKDWAHVIAPTNRRAFGFDWEDWGRLDALEVLELAEKRFQTDPRKTHLTGHSMGGHGTWNLGVHFPDRFASIAPSAGWRDFWSYGGAVRYESPDPIEALILRAHNASQTLLLEPNYRHHGIYVLHGDADRNVPVSQARFMRSRLAEFHPDWVYYERPGAGHWWGNQCMDWPPLMAFLERHVRPRNVDVRTVSYSIVNPALSASCYWVSVESQVRSMERSDVELTLDVDARTLRGKTSNVRSLLCDLSDFQKIEKGLTPGPLQLEIDGHPSEIVWKGDETPLRLLRGADGSFHVAPPATVFEKGPHRAGPFKDAFRHQMIFVYGTEGTEEENRWAASKARYDAEIFQYRGNGSVTIVADHAFDPDVYAERSVVLYGNRVTNLAWDEVVPEGAAFDLTDEFLRLGEHRFLGPHIAGMLTYPRADSEKASVAVIGGVGLSGMRATTSIPYFVSGVAYPDWMVFSPEIHEVGSKGILGAGFFDAEWQVSSDDSAVRDTR